MFLGLDLSTQQLKCAVTESASSHKIVWEEAVNFDVDLPHFGTSGGTVANGTVVYSFPLMWVEALDSLLRRLAQRGFPFEKVEAISGAAQQHASVYWSQAGVDAVQSLQAEKSLKEQLADAFSVDYSPNWQDMSTSEYCKKLEKAVGGADRLRAITGSVAYERFTGAQIAKIFAEKPDAFAKTARVALASSFLCSLLAGRIAPIDHADGSGMNLLDLSTLDWHDGLLNAACPGQGAKLRALLGKPEACDHVVGNVAPYFSQKYGFNAECKVGIFTGDNPSTLASLEALLTRPKGDVIVSLGTSDTIFLAMDRIPAVVPKEESAGSLSWHGSIFVHPTVKGRFMALLCIKNGSLVRESFRDEYAEGSWSNFDNIFSTTSSHLFSSSSESKDTRFVKFGTFFVGPEITPHAPKPVIQRYEESKTGELSPVASFSENSGSSGVNIPSLTYFQSLMMRVASTQILDKDQVSRLVAVGGGTRGEAMIRSLADVFGVPVVRSEGVENACAVGACVRAALVGGGGAGTDGTSANGESGSIVQPDLERHAAADRWIRERLGWFEREVSSRF